MVLPEYWLTRPTLSFDPGMQTAFDQLLSAATTQAANLLIPYTLPAPKWQFLCYAAERHQLALHGSGNASIHLFEPRQPVDLGAFGSQKAVYAAADGLWAMFFAIVDRERYSMSVNNACIRLIDPAGRTSEPFYVFSISRLLLPKQPWRTGFVYLLPSATFMTQPAMVLDDYQIQIPQLASLVPVAPLACLEVSPADFPFLTQIRGHDDARLAEYATAMQTGRPWPED